MSGPDSVPEEDLPDTMETNSLTQNEEPPVEGSGSSEHAKPKQPRKSKAPETLTKEPGKSLLPHARVQKILKADKELIMVQREASLLISLATEDFVQRIAEAAQRVAERERRTTVQAKDLVAAVRRAEEFAFLEELLPYLEPEPPAQPLRRKPRAEQEGEESGRGKDTMLDRFVKKPATEESQPEDEPAMNIVMNEDGTMSMAPLQAPS